MSKKIIANILTLARSVLGGPFDAPPRIVEMLSDWVGDSAAKMKKSGIKKMTQSFRVDNNDMRGWKYENLFLSAPKSNRMEALKKYGIITVTLQESPRKSRSDLVRAEWEPKNSEIIFYGYDGDPEEIESTLVHELKHWSQNLLSKATGHLIGLPGKKIRNPGVTQHGLDYGKTIPGQSYSLSDSEAWLESKRKELKDHNITKMSQLHSLDDTEFYTIMGDIVRRMRKVLNERDDISGMERNNVIRELLNADAELNAIKNFSRAKWVKMVKEVFKEIR